MKTYWPAPAKLNLFLYITGQREDGYHVLQTLFHFLHYEDLISIKVRNDGQVRLLTPLKGVPDKDNLTVRAAHLLMQAAAQINRLPVGSGVDISIEKHIPIGSGLGGGSSNAATVLVALNQLWGCRINEDDLAMLGLRLGADVPVFIYGHTAFAEGIGELLFPILLPERWYLIVYPGISVSSSLIFQDPELSRNKPMRSIETLLKCKFSNDCETIVRRRFREVDTTLSLLSRYAPFRLTGTGSCVFAEFNTEYIAYKILEKIPKWLHSFVVRGTNISSLKRAMVKHADLM